MVTEVIPQCQSSWWHPAYDLILAMSHVSRWIFNRDGMVRQEYHMCCPTVNCIYCCNTNSHIPWIWHSKDTWYLYWDVLMTRRLYRIDKRIVRLHFVNNSPSIHMTSHKPPVTQHQSNSKSIKERESCRNMNLITPGKLYKDMFFKPFYL